MLSRRYILRARSFEALYQHLCGSMKHIDSFNSASCSLMNAVVSTHVIRVMTAKDLNHACRRLHGLPGLSSLEKVHRRQQLRACI